MYRKGGAGDVVALTRSRTMHKVTTRCEVGRQEARREGILQGRQGREGCHDCRGPLETLKLGLAI